MFDHHASNALAPNSRACHDRQQHRFFYGPCSVRDFTKVTDSSLYTPLPDDWLLVLSDIQGSTRAIEQGRYKTVNMVGAACIMGILNIADEIDVPYVFGGDGATLAIPPQLADAARAALIKVRHVAREQMSLDLRIGLIPVKDLRARGLDVTLLKYRMSAGLSLAMFSGGGLSEADRLLKSETEGGDYLIPMDAKLEGQPDLEGLSCRWEPLSSRNGKIISLLVTAPFGSKDEKTQIYDEVLKKLTTILGSKAEDYRPTSRQNLRLRWPPRAAWIEAKLTAAGRGLLGALYRIGWQTAVQMYLEKSGKKAGSYDGAIYRDELIANTDFQRFDDMIRLVLDCRPDQITAIEECLNAFHEQKKIAYGLQSSDNALMTCLVFNMAEGAHVHFVDGGDGGFAFAATGMKRQLAALTSDPI
ncbi:DUF3095 domain-containing protein [Sneathiella glossodoripedis]|uniref:DUF3095 domain-containing protein n=1 Tax=Sneathiella glossodoripedis TaxID=418853 RepID=UPI000A653BE7|nr:DUF3095 domain-containing protein [Sneathiella glossodoripedis]